MHPRAWLILIGLLLAVMSCSHPNGRRYLENEEYAKGTRVFQEMLRKDPTNAEVNYYIGRFYLAQEKPQRAMPYLQRAAELTPNKANYHFWQGVAYWGVMDFEKERLSYERALALDENHIPARLYLAHNLMDNGEWRKSLVEYDTVLKKDPYNPEALYNRGLALQQLNRPAEQIDAWKRYLKHYPDGRWALRAADHLNGLGDFTYRNFAIGYRRITLEQISFRSGSAEPLFTSKASLRVVGSILSVNGRIELEILAYKNGDLALATARAKAVRDYLLQNFPTIDSSRLRYLGQGHSEKVAAGNRTYRLNESISFVTTQK